MNSPEFSQSIERLRAETLIKNFNEALDPVAFQMRDYARDAVLNDSDKYLPDEMVEQLYAAGQAIIGLPVQGELRVNKYFLAASGEAYSQKLLPHRRNGSHDFQGVVSGIGRVPVAQLREATKTVDQICLVVDPLFVLGDSLLNNYYADRGWIDQLRQPFAQRENDDQRIYLPIHMIDEKGLAVVDHWRV